MKICDKCHENKRYKDRKLCRICINEECRRYLNERKNRKCIYCGENFVNINRFPVCSTKCTLLNKIEKINDCWEWKGNFRGKYGTLSYHGKGQLAHRVSYKEFKGEINKYMLVLHKCDNPKCINPDHLFLGTHKENTHDMMKKGRMRVLRGEKNLNAKLKEKDIREIRNLLKNGKFQRSVAKNYGVHQSTIHSIETGKNWSHVIDY